MQDYTGDELIDMWREYFDGGRTDVVLRDRLVAHYFQLSLKVAATEIKKYPQHADPHSFESWTQAGLLRAVANYDPYPRLNPKTGKVPANPVAFPTYAVPAMKSCIMDGIRSLDWAPRSLRARQREIEAGRDELKQTLGRRPTDEETALHMGIETENIQKTDAETSASWHIYVEEHREQLAARPAPDPDDVPEESAAAASIRAAVAQEMDRLSAVGRTVLALHYFEELPLDRVASAIGVSNAYVNQVHKQAILQVHEAMMRAVGAIPLHV